jgi:hypothetical protein
MADSIFKRNVFVTFSRKSSFYGVYNTLTQSVYPDNAMPAPRLWLESLLDDPDLTSIQFRD